MVIPELRVCIHDTWTTLEYNEENCEFLKCKVGLCASENQQISGVSLNESDLYEPVQKSSEAQQLLALAAANGAKVSKIDTMPAYLYGYMGDESDDMVYI